jgi:hypothetical protein
MSKVMENKDSINRSQTKLELIKKNSSDEYDIILQDLDELPKIRDMKI